MKKLIVLFIMVVVSSFLSVAAQSADFEFSFGGAIQYENPIIAGGKYNENFEAKAKETNIDDFLMGLKFRADWTWGKVGLRLDLDAYYNPTCDYTALGDKLTEAVEVMAVDPLQDIEHGLKFVFNPMFHATGKFISFSVGPGAIFGWNVSQGAGAIAAVKEGNSEAIGGYLDRIGLDSTVYAISSKEGLNENLNWLQRMAFYGGELDFNLKAGLDFKVGKIVIGVNYIWDLNSNLAAWNDESDFATNMENMFSIEQTSGYLGASVLYRF